MRIVADRYELLKPLGRGGMGVVHHAVDRVLEREVAVKVLPAEMLGSATFKGRFRREAKAAASLSHPNIALVLDLGEDTTGDEPVPFIVMELLEGQTLAQCLESGPMSPEDAAAVAEGVLDALRHSHERGVIHRDVKPSNIMVHRDGERLRIKVMDFGIAKLAAETATRLTATGTLVGTPAYLSPEQAQAELLDHRSDLYSLACVLFETLTGRPPFTADLPAALLLQHIQKKPDAPSAHRPGLHPGWDVFIGTLLAKDPADRYADAETASHALRTLLASAPVPVGMPPPAPAPALPARTVVERHTVPRPTTPAQLTRQTSLTRRSKATVALVAVVAGLFFALDDLAERNSRFSTDGEKKRADAVVSSPVLYTPPAIRFEEGGLWVGSATWEDGPTSKADSTARYSEFKLEPFTKMSKGDLVGSMFYFRWSCEQDVVAEGDYTSTDVKFRFSLIPTEWYQKGKCRQGKMTVTFSADRKKADIDINSGEIHGTFTKR
ncbi:protein kinase domain-containing protein [Actinocorallia libanotica]|uniref:non-specific serine/threonine protein kinase n=1 Tax=Actinocorallia libanotica TaxID=46162 RepID=A0ABN1S112_9ACTN